MLFIGARTQLRDEVRLTAIGLVHQRRSQGEPFPHKRVAQQWDLTPGCQRRAHRSQKARRPIRPRTRSAGAGAGSFSCGQRRLSQCWMAASSRSTARRAGGCQLQPNCPRKRYQPRRDDLMRDAQLAGDLRRDHSPPKQVSSLHAALFPELQIPPRHGPTLRRTCSFRLVRFVAYGSFPHARVPAR
jgi:hypothetical protein